MIQQDITQNNEQEPYIWRYLPEYEVKAMGELIGWQEKMQRPPSLGNRISKGIQGRINRLIPEKMHQAITTVIRQMVRSILFGSEFTNPQPTTEGSLRQREVKVLKRIDFYNRLTATEGGITGAGGFLLSMADFPLFLSLKMKMLYEIAALYGHDVRDYRERLYLLRVFQLAFSSQQARNDIYQQLQDWDSHSQQLPYDVNAFDWRSFQLEYRDYLDLAKLAQMLPGIGAAVGIVVNYRMTRHLGKTAMNAYRMRWAARNRKQQTSSV